MAPTILVVGSTGNTGRSVVETLSASIKNGNKALAGHQIIALTRSSSSETARKFAKLDHVTVEEKNWVDIKPDWLQERNVVKAFVWNMHSCFGEFHTDYSYRLPRTMSHLILPTNRHFSLRLCSPV